MRLRAARAAALTLVLLGCAATRPEGLPRLGDDTATAPRTGEFVWVDLLADDPDSAARFYSGLFGWTFDPLEPTGDYATIRNGEHAIGGLIRHAPDEDDAPDDVWLASLSVADVDAAASAARRAGASVVRSPRRVGARGRVAVIRDPEGALLALLEPTGGVPRTRRAEAGDVAWLQLWARDHEVSQHFYGDLAGWGAGTVVAHGQIDESFFVRSGHEVASVIEIPWPHVEPNWLPYVAVASVDASIQRTKELGGRVLVRGKHVAILQDPEGGTIGITPVSGAAEPRP